MCWLSARMLLPTAGSTLFKPLSFSFMLTVDPRSVAATWMFAYTPLRGPILSVFRPGAHQTLTVKNVVLYDINNTVDSRYLDFGYLE